MIKKVGPHLLGYPDVRYTAKKIDEWKPQVVKDLGENWHTIQLLDNLEFIPKYWVKRYWWQSDTYGNPDQFEKFYSAVKAGNNGTWDPKLAVRIWVKMVPVVELSKSNYANIFYVESFNENGSELEAYMQFERERVLYLQTLGLKSCILNPGNGRTSREYWEIAHRTGLLDIINATKGLVGVHGYGGLHVAMWHYLLQGNDPNLIQYLRNMPLAPIDRLDTWLTFRAWRDYHDIKDLGYPNAKLVITETGLDQAGIETYGKFTGGVPIGGWKEAVPYWHINGMVETTPAATYAKMLDYIERQLVVYGDPIVGATVFQFGDSAWGNYNIMGDVVDELLELWKNNEEPTQPIPVPLPVPEAQIPQEIISAAQELERLLKEWLEKVV